MGEGHHLLLAADTVVAGVHADLALTGLDDLGWKAVAASVSDIAAMGGDPGYALVTVAGPAGTDIQLLYEGIAAAAASFGCPVVGGDLTNARDLVVTVAVTGWCSGRPVERSGARPGDDIWVTGPLGASAAGLRLLAAGAGATRDGLAEDACRRHA
ncbi:MAG TPA: AIR synthase related protein, partial [Acidimicrobiales bacterium]|nr:AIR synthase related protein [Acidimicrobiales bacterium]